MLSLLAAAVLAVAPPAALEPRVLAPDPPRQEPLVAAVPPLAHASWQVQPLARFALEARVLARHDYSDGMADLAPVDLTLGWGRMSDSAVLDDIRIALADRWWRWQSPRAPIPVDEINRSAANMHLVPANDAVRRQLASVGEGDVVALGGYLVEARRGLQSWRSSLTRGDTGDGSCELIWVEWLRVR